MRRIKKTPTGTTEKFQFTHPGKGATRIYVYTGAGYTVSIHAPWEGCDDISPKATRMELCFNSRTLGRVRHRIKGDLCKPIEVSIHAPWEGCDTHLPFSSFSSARFNSRTLGRVRRRLTFYASHGHQFQFTHPGKGATGYTEGIVELASQFQFTHPGKGATASTARKLKEKAFQFTHPGKGATRRSSI